MLDCPTAARLEAAVCYEGRTGVWRVVPLTDGLYVDSHPMELVRFFPGRNAWTCLRFLRCIYRFRQNVYE